MWNKNLTELLFAQNWTNYRRARRRIREILWYYASIRNRYANKRCWYPARFWYSFVLFSNLRSFAILLAQHNTLQVLENRHDASIRIEINAKRYWHDYTTFQIICWRLTGVNTWKVLHVLSLLLLSCYRCDPCAHWYFVGPEKLCVISLQLLILFVGGYVIETRLEDIKKKKNERRESRGSLLFNIV